MAKRRVDALMIDFYGTLTAGDRSAVDQACRLLVATHDLKMTSQEFAIRWGKQFFQLIDNSNHDSFRMLHECELQSLTNTMKGIVDDFDPIPFVNILEEYWANPPLHPESVEFLAKLDIPTCCVSNADSMPLLQAIERHGLQFDAIICSEDVQCYKPSNEIFKHALKALGVSADRAMHVGDSLHSDIGGASNTGITSVWICRNDRIHDIGTCKPEYTIHNLMELIPIIND